MEVISSYVYEVEELEGGVPVFEGFEDVGFRAVFVSQQTSEQREYLANKHEFEHRFKRYSDEEKNSLAALLEPTVRGVDQILRDYFDTSENTQTKLSVRYRRGTGRSIGLLGSIVLGPLQEVARLPVRAILPSVPHNDGPRFINGEEKADRFVVASSSAGTIAYEGPIISSVLDQKMTPWTLGTFLGYGRFRTLLAPSARELPNSTIFGIPSEALHKQKFQLSRRGGKDAFFAVDFSVLKTEGSF